MYTSWSLSYRTLPEGIFCGKLLVSHVEIVRNGLFSTFLGILAYNLFLACGPIIVANLIKVKSLPLGYPLAAYHWILYGALLGTNSFAFPSPSRVVPSLATLFHGTGIYEITAYTLLAAATCGMTVASKRGISGLSINGLLRVEKVVLVASVILLIFSNLIEAWQIIG